MPRAIDIARCPLRPSMREIRAAAAAIFNKDDVGDETEFSLSDGVVLLAYKMLTDVAVEPDYAVAILRAFRQVIYDWEWPRPLMLSLNDNRYAVMVGPHDDGAFDYKAGIYADATKLPAPLLQASVKIVGQVLDVEGGHEFLHFSSILETRL